MATPVSEKEFLERLQKGVYFNEPWQYVTDVFEDPLNPGHSVEPDEWQMEVLYALAKKSQLAVASGHGVGKSALTAWIIHWFISTRDHPQIVVTANTASQLSGKTWRELKKWNGKAVNGGHFKWTATRFYHRGDPETWFAQAVPWSEGNSEAFAGTHETSGVLMLFDEASAVSDTIYEVAAGALTTEGAKWVLFGNPTRINGRFRECFPGGKESHRWWTKQVDSRTARMTDKKKLQEWAEDYGEDSDFFRVRVRGVFPRASTSTFIPVDLVDRAMSNAIEVREYARESRILGVDVAKGSGGGDLHAICRRQGRKAWSPRTFSEIDTMQLVAEVIDEYHAWKADVVCVDGTGVGTGVVSRLRELNIPVVDVMVGSQATDPIQYFNLRTELWGIARQWLRGSVDLDPNEEMRSELSAPEFDHTGKMQLRLEPKRYTKQRLGVSPDRADSFILTFAAGLIGEARHTVLPVHAAPSNGWWTF